MIYLDKEHDTNKKYQEYDEVLTPLVVFLNNILDYQGKIRIMKEYGFKEIEKEVREVCDYANILEKEYLNKGIGIGVEKGIEQGTQNERIKNIRKLMIKLKMSFKEAIQFLDIPCSKSASMSRPIFFSFRKSIGVPSTEIFSPRGIEPSPTGVNFSP